MDCLEFQNLYPDCAFLKLAVIPQQSGAALAEQFDLYLSLSFGQQQQPLLEGRICFELKAAKLQLKLENGEISGIDHTLGDLWQVTAITSQSHPTWQLNPKPGDSWLRDSLSQLKLGTVQVTDQPCTIIATLETSLSDISLSDAEGLWRHDISPNKLAVVERVIACYLKQEAFCSHLSWVRLGVEPTTSSNSPTAAVNPDSLSRLQALLAQLYSAETDNFLDLVKLAGLNPNIDLAGGNFLATKLNSLAASGADLSRANFRGADLTDADLSEANLNQAKFGGADLSGAYLGNANLREADLHRASLALANLIGADLTKANLAQANLSQVNLSSATVTGAKFSDNPGLSEEMKLNLKRRGAIFT